MFVCAQQPKKKASDTTGPLAAARPKWFSKEHLEDVFRDVVDNSWAGISVAIVSVPLSISLALVSQVCALCGRTAQGRVGSRKEHVKAGKGGR